MKSFKQFITEATMPRLKGWGHYKTGKLELTPIKGDFKPFHQEFAANNLRKLGLKEKDAIDAIEYLYDPPTRKDAEKIFNEIKNGDIDRDNAFGDLLQKNGWYPIVLDDGMNSIGDFGFSTPKRMLKIAKAIDKKYGAKMWDLGYDSIEVGGREIYNRYDWEQYLKTGRIGVKTEIGSTMAQFREETEKSIEETIVKKGDKWLVMDKKKTKVLGTHDTEEDARRQLSAIEINKAKK